MMVFFGGGGRFRLSFLLRFPGLGVRVLSLKRVEKKEKKGQVYFESSHRRMRFHGFYFGQIFFYAEKSLFFVVVFITFQS